MPYVSSASDWLNGHTAHNARITSHCMPCLPRQTALVLSDSSAVQTSTASSQNLAPDGREQWQSPILAPGAVAPKLGTYRHARCQLRKAVFHLMHNDCAGRAWNTPRRQQVQAAVAQHTCAVHSSGTEMKSRHLNSAGTGSVAPASSMLVHN